MSMTAGELKEALKNVADDMLVFLDSDAEGNETRQLAGTTIQNTQYEENGDLYISEWAEDVEGDQVFLLWPA